MFQSSVRIVRERRTRMADCGDGGSWTTVKGPGRVGVMVPGMDHGEGIREGGIRVTGSGLVGVG